MPINKLPIFVRADAAAVEAEKTLKDVNLTAALTVLAKGPLKERLGTDESVVQLHKIVVPKIVGKWLMDTEKKAPDEVLHQLKDMWKFVVSTVVDGKPLGTPWPIENVEYLLCILEQKTQRAENVNNAYACVKAAAGRTVIARVSHVFHVCF